MSPKQRGGAWYSFWAQGDDYTNYQTESGVSSGVVRYMMYFFIFLIAIILILTLVHFLVTPIFKTTPNAEGIVSLPGSDDSKKFWDKGGSLQVLSEQNSVIGLPEFNYTVMLDISIDNPAASLYNSRPLILLARSTADADYTRTWNASNPGSLFPGGSSQQLIVYLLPMTNDLNICIMSTNPANTADTLLTTAELQNVPIRTGFNLGVVVASSFFEVYMNGKLVKTLPLTSQPKKLEAANAKLFPPSADIQNQVARVKNLRLWGRPLSPAEIRSYLSPPVFAMATMNISTPAACPTTGSTTTGP